MLYDKDFLNKLDQSNLKEVHVKITSYGMADTPKEDIIGKVISGNINIDGKSSVRRSCSLNITTDQIDLTDYYWCFNTRIQINIGIQNDINKNLPNIIWFSMGYFLITGFTMSVNTNSTSISISGKDKMCLMNGELGGIFESSVTFDTEEFEDLDGTVTRPKIPIKHIIKELVHTYGHEPYHKILINDVPDYGLELERYVGDQPFYLLANTYNNIVYTQATIDDTHLIPVKIEDRKADQNHPIAWKETIYKSLKDIDDLVLTYNNDLITTEQNKILNCQVRKYEYGNSCGYKIIDLVYPSDLVANAGESVTSILDKIVSFLGSYEYFYDLNGNFIFQKQQKFVPGINFASKTFNISDSVTKNVDQNLIVYSFDNNNLITTLQNNPNHMNIKNDFSIWGTRKSATGNDIPIHLRYAIDQRPTHSYTTIGLDEGRAAYLLLTYPNLFKISTGETPEEAVQRMVQQHPEKTYNLGTYDWRELIYQMARDYFTFNQIEEFQDWLTTAGTNSQWISNGCTGYECYYTDIEGFWRQTYKTDYELMTIYSEFENEQEYYIDNNLTAPLSFDITGPFTYAKEVLVNGQPTIQYTTPSVWFVKNEKIGIDPEDVNKRYEQVDVEEVIKNNYKLCYKLIQYWANPTEENILYIQTFNEELSVDDKNYIKYIPLEEYYTSEELSALKLLQLNILKNQEFFVKREEKYISIGCLYWPIFPGVVSAVENEFEPLISSTEIYTQHHQFINFDSDPNMQLMKALAQHKIITYWDQDFFPFDLNSDEYDTSIESSSGYFESLKGFNKTILKNPENLNFWFDFCDNEFSDVSKYNIKRIGDRKKVISDNAVKAIYYLDIPDVLFDLGTYDKAKQLEFDKYSEKGYGYAAIHIPEEIQQNFIISAQGKSAYAALEDLLFNHTYCTDSITLTAIPVYYLQPNTIIAVNDAKTNIAGQYVIEKLSFAFAANSTMNISGIKYVSGNRDRKEIFVK